MGTAVDASLAELRRRVTGPVYPPEDDGYAAECAGFQRASTHAPAVAVGVTDPTDVCAAIEFAGAHDLPVAVQGIGHGLSVPADGGVLISTRRLTDSSVDANARTASIGAGVDWVPVLEAANEHQLAPLAGSAPHVGAVAYTLGGGLGHLARRYGYAADHVRSMDVVTADAQLHQLTPDSDPDLFWALRGGRDNFGVVTRMSVDLVPVPVFYGGALTFDSAYLRGAVQAYLEWTADQPDEMTTSIALIPYPDVPAVPEPVRGRHVASVRVAFLGDRAEGERLVAPLRQVGPRLVDTLRELPYRESGTIYNDPTRPDAYHGTNALLRDLPAAAAGAVVDRTGSDAAVPCIVEIRHLGGALVRAPEIPNAVGHRDARYLLRVFSPVGADQAAEADAVHGRAFEAVTSYSLGRSLNFVYGAHVAAAEISDAYAPADYARLRQLKARYDPRNMFRVNLNIPPA
jgi:FAD/FMN-containing dehydrogenase